MSISLFTVVFVVSFLAQVKLQPVQEEKIYTVSEVSVKPEPVKGMNEFHNRWSKKVIYPAEAVEAKVQGMVFVEFIVNTDGTIIGAGIKSGIGHGCDEAALRGFLEASKEPWKPAMKTDKPVKVKMVVPFSFRIIEN